MCNHNFLLHPGSLALSVSVSLCLAVSASLSSHLVLDLVEVMASAHIPPPPGHRKPWKQSGEGGNHSCGAPSYWCSRLAARLVTNNQKGLHSNSRTWREGIFKCKHWSNMSGAGSRLDPVTEQNGGPGWCAAILEQNILSMHAMSPNYVEISSLNCSAKKWQQNDLEQQRQLTK